MNKNSNLNEDLIKETIDLIHLSSMDDSERAMWMKMLPKMEKQELEKFHKILAQEIKKMADIYMHAKERKQKEQTKK